MHPDECERCLRYGSICNGCRWHYFPHLATPSWVRLVGANNGGRVLHIESAEATRKRELKERKAIRRAQAIGCEAR